MARCTGSEAQSSRSSLSAVCSFVYVFFDIMEEEESADSCFWCRRRCVFDAFFFGEVRWANKLDGGKGMYNALSSLGAGGLATPWYANATAAAGYGESFLFLKSIKY